MKKLLLLLTFIGIAQAQFQPPIAVAGSGAVSSVDGHVGAVAVTWYPVAVLPAATAAVTGRLYRFSAATANYCLDAGDAGGGVNLSCVSDGTHYSTPVALDSFGNASLPGNLAIGNTVVDATLGPEAPRLMIIRTANGAIAAHSLVKGVASGKVGPVASDTEGILGVAENATTTDGDTVYVTQLGPTTILCESSTDLNYLVAGTDPTKAKDSGAASLNSLPLTTRIVGKAMGTCSGGVVTANVMGPYRFGAQPPAINLPTPGATCAMSGNSTVCVCTTTCTITPLAPVAGSQLCARNDTGVSTVITLAAIASVFYEKTDNSAYGTVNTAATSGGTAQDKICLFGRDATHYHTWSFGGVWTVN